MQIFINECSLNEQFESHNFVASMKNFLKIVDTLNKFNDKNILKSKTLYHARAIKDSNIEKSLKLNFELNSVFTQNLKSAVNWDDYRTHDLGSSYIYKTDEYCGTS